MSVTELGKVCKWLDKLHYVVSSRPPMNASFLSPWKVSAYGLEFNIVNIGFPDFLLFSRTFRLRL